MRDKALRLAFHLPWHHAIMRRILKRRSEITLEEARFLGELVRSAPAARPIIEIGTLFGGSTRIIALFKQPQTKLVTVDSFRWNPFGLTCKQHGDLTRDILSDEVQNSNVQIRDVDKNEFYAGYSDGPPGLVFLDANHSYESTKADLVWARKVGAALVCGHDYSQKFPGVMKAVQECGGAKKVVGTLFQLDTAS